MQDELNPLIAACLQGDQTAYAALYEQCAPQIYRLCYGLLMNRHDAEDVQQETFVYAFRNLRRFDNQRSAFRTWLYTIALSRCRNVYRRGAWQRWVGWLTLDLPAPAAEQPEAHFAQANMQAEVLQALRQLSPILREAVVLRYGHGLTYREIGEVVGCPSKTAESRIRLAHEQLRGRLQSVHEAWFSGWEGAEWA